MPLRNRLIIQTELEGKLPASFVPVVDWALGVKWLRRLVEVVIRVHAGAPTPKAQFHLFMRWWKHYTFQTTGVRGALVSFRGCVGGYFEVSTPVAIVRVLERLGYRTLVSKQGRCGSASQPSGLLDTASKSMLKLRHGLRATGDNSTVISSSGSCTGVLHHEVHKITGVGTAELRDVGSRVVKTGEFLAELLDEDEFPIEELRPTDLEVAYHQPCQVKSQGIGKPAIRLLEAIPGMKVVESGEPCYGIGGIYGLKKERFKVIQAIGKPLFNKIRATDPELVLCEIGTYR